MMVGQVVGWIDYSWMMDGWIMVGRWLDEASIAEGFRLNELFPVCLDSFQPGRMFRSAAGLFVVVFICCCFVYFQVLLEHSALFPDLCF